MQALELNQIGVSRLRQAGISNPEFEASILLCHLLQINRAELFIHREDLPVSLISTYHDFLARRCNREPLAYILGEWEFWSLPFSVSPEVLIPRPETEVLVEHVVKVAAAAANPESSFRILDMGSGSGILSVILALELPKSRIYSLDIDRGAQKVARANAGRHNVADRVFFLNADWLQAFRPDALFDFIVANPPYVAEETFPELQPEVREFEPRIALDGGKGGLMEISRFASELVTVLKPGGHFFMEIGADQNNDVTAVFAGYRELVDLAVINDYAGLPRVFRARKSVACDTNQGRMV